MYIVCILMFVVGIILTGLSFSLAPLQGLFFILGVLLVAGALAIPIHSTQSAMRK